MAGLRDLNSKLDYFWNEYNRRFPGLFYTDERGRRSMPLIVAGQALRNDHAPLYLRRLVDQDPTSWYMLVAANPLTGAPCDHDTATEFFHDFFYTKLGMPSSYDVQSGMRPTRENPLFGTMDEWQACKTEVLPAADVAQQKYDEIMSGRNGGNARRELTPEEKARRNERLGFDPDDGNTIDVVDEPSPAASTQATTDITEYAGNHKYEISFANKICYAVDFHMSSTGVEIGYNGRGGSRVGGRRTGRLGHGGAGRLGFGESKKLKEAVTPVSDDDAVILSPADIGKKIAGMFDQGNLNLQSGVFIDWQNSTYGVGKIECSGDTVYFHMLENKNTDVLIQDMLDQIRELGFGKFSEIETLAIRNSNRLDVIGVRLDCDKVILEVDDILGKRAKAAKLKAYRNMFDSEIDEALVKHPSWVNTAGDETFDPKTRTTFKKYEVEYIFTDGHGHFQRSLDAVIVMANSLLDLIRKVNKMVKDDLPAGSVDEFTSVIDMSKDDDITEKVNQRIKQVLGESKDEESDPGETSKLTAGDLQKKIKDFETESEKKDFAVTVKLPDGTEAEDVTAEVEEGKVTIVCPAPEEETPEEAPAEDAEDETPEEAPVKPEDAEGEESDPVNESISQDYADYCRTLIAD